MKHTNIRFAFVRLYGHPTIIKQFDTKHLHILTFVTFCFKMSLVLVTTQISCALILQSSFMNEISFLPSALRVRVASTQAPLPLKLANICESNIVLKLIGLLKHHEYWPLHCLRVPPIQNEIIVPTVDSSKSIVFPFIVLATLASIKYIIVIKFLVRLQSFHAH
jgi:hypothetical protein